ncbi:uncharacterized protein LOC134840590 isoform X2 [Symsagittifera roscoffensis]|uniref:uncharacterized protein LOC134840590 isoform X2 n=1 Tax=Symsagittifera roscoffensis TaxID=84072 RepID=UPI00307C34A5
MSYQIEDFQNFNQFSFIQNGLELRKKLEEELKSYNRKQTVVLFRHGHRTPFKYRQPGISALLEDSFYGHLDMQCFEGKEELLYQNIQCISSGSGSVADLNLQFDVHKQNAGMLTRLGASQLNTVGRKLKERYSEDLKKIISICSTNKSEPLLNISTKTERTIESLQSVLLGLFQDEKTQPSFRVKVLDTSENNWLGYSLHRHPDLLDGIGTAHSHDFKCKYIKGYETWASSLIQTTGASPESIDLQMIRDYMTSFERFGYPLPDSLSQIAEDKVLCGRMTTYAVAAESMLDL